MLMYQHLQLLPWYNSHMKNVTISQAEYDAFLAQKAQIQEMQARLDWLLEQVRLAKHKQFGRSSEQLRDEEDR